VSNAPDAFTRLILFRPRPAFALPPEWAMHAWIPLGELRPLLQGISPVRDLSDLWRWVALPLPRSAVEMALADFPEVVLAREGLNRGDAENAERDMEGSARLYALLVPAEEAGVLERIELSPVGADLLGLPSPAAMAAMQKVAAALRRACGCMAVGL
jgi:hypothetical protein